MRVTAAIAIALAAGCASAPPPLPARLSVEILSGAPRELPPEGAPALAVIVDLGPAMRQRLRSGPTGDAAARAGASALVRAAPAGTTLSMRVLGASDERCGGGFELDGAAPDELSGQLARIDARSADSVAYGLDGARASLERAGDLARARVVVYSDLEDSCGGDLCASAAALVAGGAVLDFVLLGDAPAPACLADLKPAAGPPASLAQPAPLVPFRVDGTSATAGAPPDALASGVTDGVPVGIAPGSAVVEVRLDPPLRIGPLDLAPGSETRVRVVDFPRQEGSARSFSIETRGAPAAPDAAEAAP